MKNISPTIILAIQNLPKSKNATRWSPILFQKTTLKSKTLSDISAVDQVRNSSHNLLTKISKNESPLRLANSNSANGNDHQIPATKHKIPTNSFASIANNSNNNNSHHKSSNNSNILAQQQTLRNSTISQIESLLKSADPQTLSQMQRIAQSASLLHNGFGSHIKTAVTVAKQASLNLNHNFKSINNNTSTNNNNSNNNVSSFTAFSNKSVNSNSSKNPLSQEVKVETKSGWSSSRNDLSDMSESSYKSTQFEQKQQEQEMGSRRKRKSIVSWRNAFCFF